MKTVHFADPLRFPETGEDPETYIGRAIPLGGTPGQDYVERRGISRAVADAAGVHYAPDYLGRPAVVVALRGETNAIVSVHGRYLTTVRGQNKMFTFGPGDGLIRIGEDRRTEPLILVEGLFDALSMAVCGYASSATIGRWAKWMPTMTAGRTVMLAFDACRPGEADAIRYKQRLPDALTRRLIPPPRCKDWNTALVKRGQAVLKHWLDRQLAMT